LGSLIVAELLLELFSEEIPARMQARAEADIARMLEAAFKEKGLTHDDIATFSTPRRLVAVVNGLPTSTPDTSEERRGPRVDAPEKAIEGFKNSLPQGAVIEQRAEKKGTFFYARIEEKGGVTIDAISNFLPKLIENFPWPKSMRWGTKAMRWVRPLQSMLCLFDGQTVSFEVDGIGAGNVTQGHRFMSSGELAVKDFADYKKKLRAANVILDPAERREIILKDATKLAEKAGLELIEDEALLIEVGGLVEWPVVMMGNFSTGFMDVPAEALISEMKHHQKYFSTRDKDGELSNHFIFVSNIEGDADAIIDGNARVLGARLADAKFFWDRDCAKKLDDFLPALDDIIFHERLGSVGERVERIEKLAGELAEPIGCKPELAKRAAHLAKADLVSGMVGEFPDLQGVMGGYYVAAQGEDAAVAAAIRDQYSPKGPDDACPTAPVSVALALAEKIDSLVGFFAIDEKPTGSKDPFALRRAALGVIRLITENNIRINLREVISIAIKSHSQSSDKAIPQGDQSRIVADLLTFFADRLKVQQREKGVRHDLIDAVFSLGGEDDLVRLLKRVEALQSFLATDDGENLLAGYKRATNIVRIEEKKDGTKYDGPVDPEFLEAMEEKVLHDAIELATAAVNGAVEDERYGDAMAAIAVLRAPIDTFFDSVKVNVDDAGKRANRLRLLASIGTSLHGVADFSQIEG
jgi:glycyl-tRNA synthetase beta chain